MAILGSALFVLLDAHYTALKLNETMQEEVVMRQLIETIVAKAEVQVLIGTLSDAGDFGNRYPGYTWSFDATLIGRDQVPLYAVHASVEGPLERREMDFRVFNNSPEEAQNGDSMFNNSRRGTSGNTGNRGNTGNTGNNSRNNRSGGGLF